VTEMAKWTQKQARSFIFKILHLHHRQSTRSSSQLFYNPVCYRRRPGQSHPPMLS
jgi:hypothetical protein